MMKFMQRVFLKVQEVAEQCVVISVRRAELPSTRQPGTDEPRAPDGRQIAYILYTKLNGPVSTTDDSL